MKKRIMCPKYKREWVALSMFLLLGLSQYSLAQTVPDSPSKPDLTVASSTIINASWNAPANDGGSPIIQYLVKYWPSSGGAAVDRFTTLTTYSITDLSPATAYTVEIYARNAVGYSAASSPSEATTLSVAPVITSYVADDPDNGDTVFGNHDTVTLNFDMDTNTPSVGTKVDVDALLTFSSSLGSSYSGTWTDAQTLQISISDITGGSPIIGVSQVTVKASGLLKNAAETSEVCTDQSPPLSGDWGDGSLSITLHSFSAEVQGSSIALKWTTESETNHLGFILERSSDGQASWQVIASHESHEALKGRGNHSTRTAYTFVDNHVEYGQAYGYRLSDVNQALEVTRHAPLTIQMADLPETTQMENAYPNPFNPQTYIAYQVAEAERVHISVFDVLGRRVSVLLDEPQLAGSYHVYWHGLNEDGERVPSGSYFIRMVTKTMTQVQKVTLVK